MEVGCGGVAGDQNEVRGACREQGRVRGVPWRVEHGALCARRGCRGQDLCQPARVRRGHDRGVRLTQVAPRRRRPLRVEIHEHDGESPKKQRAEEREPDAKGTKQCLPIEEITIDAGTQARAVIEEAIVDEYADQLTEGATFPPVTVFQDGSTTYLADGFHRLEAHRRAGRGEIEAGLLRRAEDYRERLGRPQPQCLAAAVVDVYNRGRQGKSAS